MLACFKSESSPQKVQFQLLISIIRVYSVPIFLTCNSEVHFFTVMIVVAVHHMAGSLDKLVSIRGQHHLEITRTNILIDTHFSLPEVDLLFSENTRNLLIH